MAVFLSTSGCPSPIATSRADHSKSCCRGISASSSWHTARASRETQGHSWSGPSNGSRDPTSLVTALDDAHPSSERAGKNYSLGIALAAPVKPRSIGPPWLTRAVARPVRPNDGRAGVKARPSRRRSHKRPFVRNSGEFETCPTWVPGLDKRRRAAPINLKIIGRPRFDHSAIWAAKVRNVSRLGSQTRVARLCVIRVA